MDEGAEALLARRPEGTGLIRAVGLAGQLAAPGTTAARIWSRGQLVPLPRRQFMGVPADLDELARCGLLSAAGMARARQISACPPPPRDGDVRWPATWGPGSARRWWTGWWTRCSAGCTRAGRRSCRSRRPCPALAEASRRHASLAEAAGCAAAAARATPGTAGAAAPAAVFTTLRRRARARLPAAVAAASGAEVRTGAMVRELARTARRLAADRRIRARPAVAWTPTPSCWPCRPGPPARLLAGLPGAAAARAALAEIAYASMAIVTLAYPAPAFPRPLEGSGYLVPAVDGRPVKAVTFSSVKWPHLRSADPGMAVVRCSLGRVGEEAAAAARRRRPGGPGRGRPGRGDRGPRRARPTSG